MTTTKELYMKIDKDVLEGAAVKDACNKYAIKRDNYYAWRKHELAAGRSVAPLAAGKKKIVGKLKSSKPQIKTAKKSAPRFIEIPVVPAQQKQAAIIIGSIEQIMTIAKGLNQ
jgi:hypothetical protein